MSAPAKKRRRARGQAITEYAVIVAFCVIVLILATANPSPIKELLDAIKSFYAAYSYVISISA